MTFLVKLHHVLRHYPYLDADKLGQSGYADVFQDPDAGQNQAHHYWFYVQVGADSGGPIGILPRAGVIAHETFLSRTQAGQSFEDVALGFVGVDMGIALSTGTVNLSQVGNAIRNSLGPHSQEARTWSQLRLYYMPYRLSLK